MQRARNFRPVSTSCSSWSAAWPRTGIRSRAPFHAGVDDDGSYGTVAEFAPAAARHPENARPLATELDNRKAEVNNDIEQLGEDYLRLSALGSYGAFFNIYFCSVTIKINGPAGSDILLPIGGQPDPSKGGAPLLNRKPSSKHERDPLRTGIFGLVLVICVVLIAFGYSGLPFWPQGKTYDAYFTDAGGSPR